MDDKDDAMQKGKQKEVFREKKTRSELRTSELPSGRIILKDATTLAQLLKLLEPFEDGKSVKGVRAFRGIEAAMALNHLHRLRDDPLKDAAQHEALLRQTRSFARKVEEDMDILSPKNIAWALNSLKGMENFDSVFEKAAKRLCQIPSSHWGVDKEYQSAALIMLHTASLSACVSYVLKQALTCCGAHQQRFRARV
jgi:hypothetical protein